MFDAGDGVSEVACKLEEGGTSRIVLKAAHMMKAFM